MARVQLDCPDLQMLSTTELAVPLTVAKSRFVFLDHSTGTVRTALAELVQLIDGSG